MSFTKIIVRYPYVILIAVTVFAGTCLIVPLTLRKIPDFSDPQLVRIKINSDDFYCGLTGALGF